jgi:2-haloacid dehalogenase
VQPRIEAVVFDVGKVIVEWDLRELYRELIPDPAQREWFVETVVTPEWHFQHDAGRALAEMVAERQAQFPKHAALIAHYAVNFNASVPGPVPGTHELIEALDKAGVPLYGITNFGAEFWPKFRPEWPVLERFRDVVVSGVEKIVKPDPAIFRLAERRFGHAPQAMLFIDDNLANIEAARKLGWHGHHFTGAHGLRAELLERGLIA